MRKQKPCDECKNFPQCNLDMFKPDYPDYHICLNFKEEIQMTL